MAVLFNAERDERVKYVLGALVLVLILLQMRLWSGAGSLEDINRLEHEIVAQELDNAVLQERNGILKQEVTDLKTGQDAIEERARSELGLVKKGETFYLIVEKQNAQGPALEISPDNKLLIEPAPIEPEAVPEQPPSVETPETPL